MNRKLTPGEIRLIADALASERKQTRLAAFEYRKSAAPYLATQGEDSEVVRRMTQHADKYDAEAHTIDQLIYVIRRYGLSIEAPLLIPELI